VKPWGGRAGIDFAFSEDQLAIRAAIEKICSFDLPHLRPRTEEQRNTMLMRATLSPWRRWVGRAAIVSMVLALTSQRRESNDTDARLWHPWLRINRVLRVMLRTRWSAEAWAQVGVEFRRAFALRNQIRRPTADLKPMSWPPSTPFEGAGRRRHRVDRLLLRRG
jgi:hypothetical protein